MELPGQLCFGFACACPEGDREPFCETISRRRGSLRDEGLTPVSKILAKLGFLPLEGNSHEEKEARFRGLSEDVQE